MKIKKNTVIGFIVNTKACFVHLISIKKVKELNMTNDGVQPFYLKKQGMGKTSKSVQNFRLAKDKIAK